MAWWQTLPATLARLWQQQQTNLSTTVLGMAGVLLAVAVGSRLYLNPSYPVPPAPSVVLVTGTSSGIGENIVQNLASQGYHVFAGVRTRDSAREWARRNDKHPYQHIEPIILDVTKTADIEAAATAVRDYTQQHNLTFGGLVNNCGKAMHMPLEFHDVDDVRDLFETNVIGPLALTQKLLPLLRRDQGRIVFTSSLAGFITQPKEGVYAATKHGVESIGDALRQELAPYHVSVSLVEPGFVHTPIIRKIMDSETMGNETAAAHVYDRLYTDKFFDNFDFGIKHAGKPSQVTRKVLAALRDSRPKTRYQATTFMGIPTWLIIRLKQILPDRLLDKALV